MKKLKPNLPDYISAPNQAEQFADLYRDGASLVIKCFQLEQQTVFWLMLEALDHPDIEFKSIALEFGDDEGDSVFIALQGVDEADDLTVYDETEEVGASLIEFLQNVHFPHYGDEFIATLSKPLTHENKWVAAETLFGKETRAKMEADCLARSTPKSSGKSRSARM